MKPTLKITKDFTEEFNKTIKKFKNDAVLVGIPEADTYRKKNKHDEDSPITNAAILAINHFGSPANNIPPRPVLSIGIKLAQNEIAEQFKQACIQALSKGFSAVDTYYNRAGLVAANSVKLAINDQEGIDEPAESTLARRRAQGFKGDKALIVTGQLRNSITYVVRGDDG
jgi:hypothetical protein